MAKGASYEREICKQISLWWTGGAEDHVFWRSHGSGGRATSRARVGKRTAGQEGDICAVDDVGLPFTRLITPEIKRGYSDCNVQQLLDRLESRPGKQEFEGFLWQAIEASERADTRYWMLIHRRDQRKAMVWFPTQLFKDLGLEKPGRSAVHVACPIRDPAGVWQFIRITGMQLDTFLAAVDPSDLMLLED